MSSNGHVVAATWRAEDFADLDTYNGLVSVTVFPGKPPIQVDSRSYDQLVFEGVAAGNPLAAAALEAFYDGQRRADAVESAGAPPVDIAERSARAWDLQDKILAAIVKSPPYCPKERLVDGRPPAGHFWYGSFTGEQRRRLVDFFYNGAEALKSFRPHPQPDEHAVRAGSGVSPAPEQHPDSAGAAVSAVVAGRGGADLAAGAGADGAGERDGAFVYVQ